MNPRKVRPYFTEKKTYISNRLRAEELAIKYHQIVRDLKNGQVFLSLNLVVTKRMI